MCWTHLNAEKKIAQEDIHVFKICRCIKGKIRPYYFYNHSEIVYINGQTYTSPVILRDIHSLLTPKITKYVIDVGLHSYSCGCTVMPDDDETLCFLHDENGEECAYCTQDVCVVLCSIPKGAEYYVNYNGEYVSNLLRIESVVEGKVITKAESGKFTEKINLLDCDKANEAIKQWCKK